MDEAKGLWAEYFHEILWSYHNIPHSTIKETPFQMVYRADAMIPMEVNSPIYHRINFDNNLNKEGLDSSIDLIEEIRRMAHVRECVAKQKMTRRFNTRVHLRNFQEGDLVLKNITYA